MAFPGRFYAPPGVFTETRFDSPITGALDTLKIPIIIGEGNELLQQLDFEQVRGSSADVDQRIVSEDTTGRAVVEVLPSGQVTLGAFDGTIQRFQVRNFPIVSGDGSGAPTTDRTTVQVTVNGTPIVVVAVDGTNGFVDISVAPTADDDVRVTYFFNRTDTRTTDDLSAQVTDANATIYGSIGISDVDSPAVTTPPEVVTFYADQFDANGNLVTAGNNLLELTVDGESDTIEFPPNDYNMGQVASIIGGSGLGSLTASTYINNFGQSALLLVADEEIVIGSGSANGPLGLVAGSRTARRTTFYTFNGPIVVGDDGGVTTTDPANVTVKVDNVQVIPTAVDGQTRAVTLPFAPAAGSRVTIQYWFNTWQDTFDYLNHINVNEVVRCGDVPNQSAYFEGADFVLKDDRLLWGTAVLISSGVTTQGSELFGETQITTTLVDNRTYMMPAAPLVDTSTGIGVDSRTQFQLPFQPTLGNGRDTALGQSLFQTLSNNRIDVPVNRPDVIDAYWGYSVQDALDRGKVNVVRVEDSVISLASAVPAGATVYATFYYNLLTDNEFTLTNVVPGPSGVGSYQVTDQSDDVVLVPQFDRTSKGAGLLGVVLNFPSGSELISDVHYEAVEGLNFSGPVEEIVEVQFASREATPAKYAAPGNDPYAFINNQSDHLRLRVDSAELAAGLAGIDLANPSTYGAGFFASLVGREIEYTGGTVGVVGETYDLAAPEEMNLFIDGVQIRASIDDTTAVTVDHFVDRLNDTINGHTGAAGAATAGGLVELAAASRSTQNGYYVDWVIVIGDPAAAAGKFQTVTAYDGTTGLVTVGDLTWSGTLPAIADVYTIYHPDHLAQYTAATQFNSSYTVGAAGEYGTLDFHYTGDATGISGALSATLAPGTYASPTTLAAALEAAMATAVGTLGATFDGLVINVEANGDGQLVFSMQRAGIDTVAMLEFLTAGAATDDFAILAGISTDAATGDAQAKLIQGEVARRFTPSTVVTKLLHDRLMLRNRLLPGDETASVAPNHYVDQMQLDMLSGSGNDKAGMANEDTGHGGSRAVVEAASLVGRLGFAGGQIATGTFGDEQDLQPIATFFDGTGPTPANNVFDFTVDGVPVSVTFTADSDGEDTPLGPAATATTVMGQIIAAMAALPGEPFGDATNIRDTLRLVRPEGAGIRITSALFSVSSAVVIGAGSANGTLGFSEGAVSQRGLVTARQLASALNSNRNSSFATWWQDFSATTATWFAAEALAWVEENGVGQEFLYVQSASLGTGSILEFREATVASVQTQDVLFFGTNLLIEDGDGATGENALEGFFVTSNNSSGSGSSDTSVLNDGTGQDGIIGQTYRDEVTGLTFTILPRGFQDNPSGPWVPYPTGATATFRFNAFATVLTNANLPVNAMPGVELTVANTIGVGVGDTAIVETFERGGNEPPVGDVYYVSYVYQKPIFVTQFFTKLSAIEQNFGEVSPDNPVSLAAFLAIFNGAVVLGIKQVLKEDGQRQASLTSYRDAIDELENPLPGQVNPDMIQLLRGDSDELYQYLARSNDKMSSIRFKSERTSIVGLSGGRLPAEAKTLAQLLSNTRMRVAYPDLVTLTLTDPVGVTTEYLVDGTFLATALVGSIVSPNFDVATPWTGRNIVGFNVLARRLNAVEQNQLAQRGVTVFEERPPFLRVRHGLTTDITDILTKTPTVVQIADEVQRQARVTLDRFIGVKFVPGILGQIEGRIATMLRQLVQAQIITQYTGIKATPAADDPTVAEVEAFYMPVFPLLYILLTFHLRSSL